MDIGYTKMWFVNYIIKNKIWKLLGLHKQNPPHFQVVYQRIVGDTSSRLDIQIWTSNKRRVWKFLEHKSWLYIIRNHDFSKGSTWLKCSH